LPDIRLKRKGSINFIGDLKAGDKIATLDGMIGVVVEVGVGCFDQPRDPYAKIYWNTRRFSTAKWLYRRGIYERGSVVMLKWEVNYLVGWGMSKL
jgi:hypothetical protein